MTKMRRLNAQLLRGSAILVSLLTLLAGILSSATLVGSGELPRWVLAGLTLFAVIVGLAATLSLRSASPAERAAPRESYTER